MKSLLTPNRIVAILTAVCGLAGAIAVPVANLDLSSTAGVAAGLGTIVAAALSWLKGWQAHEARMVPPTSTRPTA